MASFGIKITVGTFKRPSILSRLKLQNAFFKAADKTLKLGEETAKKKYLEQRKTNKTPSAVISSIKYKKHISGLPGVTGILFAGGSDAHYAQYLEFGHKLRDGSWWPKGKSPQQGGYNFMQEAWLKMSESAKSILIQEMRGKQHG